MGKRQHQKDKMYLTYTEWSTLYGGRKSGTLETSEEKTFRRLPFNHCCLTLQPFEHPYCDAHGNVFELEAILEYLKRYKHNPVTSKPLDAKSLIKLNFHKNVQDEYQCPVLYKLFTKHSHIVAIKTTGNVFSYEAVEQLNIKAANWKDLINDQPFERKDIITIQDPTDAMKFNLSTFHHIKNNIRMEDEETIRERNNPNAKLKTVSTETKEILEELEREYKPAKSNTEDTFSKQKADKFNAAHYSTGAVAAGFTSTVMPAETTHQAAVIAEDLVRYERVKKKGYVRLFTNFGALNLELFCDLVPKTCENFIKHSENGYYNGTKFHRSIRNFMIQGGDPTNTGNGGESIWGKPFEDEFKPVLSHLGRGILSMANSGPNTNGSQFFITFRSCKHLDRKHTVFGKIVGGFETLNAIEKVEVDNKDRPIEDIVLQAVQVFVNPFQEADEQLASERAAEMERLAQEANQKNAADKTDKNEAQKVYRSGIGKYVKLEPEKADKRDSNAESVAKKKRISTQAYGDFSSFTF
ncbi:RING-type E3 ubiquitin-protein ligase PPIL2 isoform X2 [Odontomachus brunneus]|uniref:RING-type E3 ubiquitin-protein ligase PPIL2 isoform X2 n=1 Tax=Odontomachus brunneus TaxID=486640 RepID=UPI0013F27E52|nr:RING-type E3 ubiquitin-protein ligase PPIL2 isoform X2 [Odontomachus brunneus]XP_032667951.1 RING-type E3 ubiquitin-protein ligase PPIL2 isoform X2 [Odontomachus brunneus]